MTELPTSSLSEEHVAVLSALDLCKSYHQLQANVDVSLDVYPGEIHALIGPNGAGKSTLIKQIAGSLKPDTGKVLLNGVDVTGKNTVARARMGLARTFQVSALALEDTVLQNAMLGAQVNTYELFRPVMKNQQVRERAEHALQRLGLLEQSAKRAEELSHGERRQLEIAVALTLNPKVFVMDEPMAGLGAQGTQSLIQLLHSLRLEAPILMVEHDMNAVFELADRISVLVYGKIIATGTVDQIRNNERVLQAYLGEAV